MIIIVSTVTTWPEGTFAFPEPKEGCPAGFVHGCRYQDNEDWRNSNTFSNTMFLKGEFSTNLEVCYCLRQTSVSSYSWPPGRYCVNEYNSCPTGFLSGQLKWDDENIMNLNSREGVLPTGQYNHDTVMRYCCRNDGNVNTPIVLPTSKPFVLYMHSRRGCQKVRGMRESEIRINTDDEESNNRNYCRGSHPYDEGCGGRNHRLFMCYYAPS